MPNLIIKIPATEIILPYKGLNFKQIEEKIMEALKNAGKQAVETAVIAVDKHESKGRLEGLSIKGISRKYLNTVFGTFLYNRRRYNEAGKSGSRYLADEKLGIKKGISTSPVREMMESELAVLSGSYRKASAFANKYLLDGRSHESIRQVVFREGTAMREHQEAAIENERVGAYSDKPLFADSSPAVAYVEVDGTGLKIQKNKGCKKKRRRNMEVKLGIMYTGKERRYVGGNGKQKKLKDKYVYASLEKADVFMEKLSLICEKVLKISEAKKVVLGGDGAKWIKEGWKSYFYRAVYVLCLFHLNRAIMRAFGYSKELQKKVKDLIRRDNIDDAIKLISKIINKTGIKNYKRKRKLRELRDYIINNRDGINALNRLKDVMPADDRKLIKNTGAVESNIRSVITRRMKKMGQSWSVDGAGCLLAVICRMQNEGGLDNWYGKERQEKIEIREEDYQRLVANTVWADRSAAAPSPAAFPALRGPHQDRVWAEVLRSMTDGESVSHGNDVEESETGPEVAIN